MGGSVGVNGQQANNRKLPLVRSLALALGLGIAGCGGGTPPGIDEPASDVRESVAAALRQCTIENGYSPDSSAGLGQTQLGEGELDWRDCAYDALDRVLRPNLSEPEALDALIEDDERLTDAIEAGSGTRAERSAMLSARIESIKTREQQVREENLTTLSAGALLDATNSDTEYQRIRGDIEVITRLF